MSSSASSNASSAVAVAGWIVGSVCSSVGLILVNKVIMKTYVFSFVFTLTALHFLVTALGMEVMAILGLFTRVRLPPLDSALMAVCCIGSVAFMNFSLSYNSVGFYQVTKLLCIPAMIVIQTYLYQQQFSVKIKLVLVVVLAGVGVATVSDVELNTVGCIMGALAVVFTAQFQIWQGEKQKVNKMDAMQMNHAQALPSFAFCLVLSLLVDHWGQTPTSNVRLHTLQSAEMAWIALSCVLALSVNLCTYGLIGKTSAVTYQVVGHAKTCLILLGGFVFFPPTTAPPTSAVLKNAGGICVALIGVVVYSHLKIAENGPPGQSDWCDAMLPASFLGWAERQFGTAVEGERQTGQYAPVETEEGKVEHTTTNGNLVQTSTHK